MVQKVTQFSRHDVTKIPPLTKETSRRQIRIFTTEKQV